MVASKDVIDEGTDYELPCFWILAYDVIETENIGGVEYDIVEYSLQGGVTAIEKNHVDPLRSISRFKIDEIDFAPE